MTKRLMLMRHGDYYNGELSDRGARQAENVAKQLVEDDLVPDVILHSPVERAVQTAQHLHDVFNQAAGRDVPMVEQEWLADGSYSSVEDVASLDDTKELVLAVSHMPNIEELNDSLANDHHSPGNCQTFVIDTRVDHWKDVSQGSVIRVLEPS